MILLQVFKFPITLCDYSYVKYMFAMVFPMIWSVIPSQRYNLCVTQFVLRRWFILYCGYVKIPGTTIFGCSTESTSYLISCYYIVWCPVEFRFPCFNQDSSMWLLFVTSYYICPMLYTKDIRTTYIMILLGCLN